MSIIKQGSEDKYVHHILQENLNLMIINPHRILIRSDHHSIQNEVKIVSGGACRHAPLHSGLVGPGGLTGAVLGDLYNTPTCLSMLAALRELGRDHPPGVLLIAMNSPAERLVAMLACQQADSEGIKTKCVIVGEDVSGVEVNRMTGRRGHCGVVFLQKIAGAMAQEGKSLEEIYILLTRIKKKSLGTINWWLEGEKVITGPGLKQKAQGNGIDIGINDGYDVEIITKIITKSIVFLFSPVYKYSLDISEEDEIAVIINNMGQLSELDFTIVCGEIRKQLHEIGIKVVRCYCGNFLTTRTSGVSLSVLKVNYIILKWLDSPISVKTWPLEEIGKKQMFSLNGRIVTNTEKQRFFSDKKNKGPNFSVNEAELVINILSNVANILEREEKTLNELDEDLDFGTTLKKLSQAVKAEMDHKTLNIVTPFGLLNNLAELSASSMGGMAGPVFSILLSGASKAFLPHFSYSHVSWSMWLDAAAAARASLSLLMPTQVGDNTILDALHPFVETFKTPTLQCFGRAVEVVQTVTTHFQDPGAMSLFITLNVIRQDLNLDETTTLLS